MMTFKPETFCIISKAKDKVTSKVVARLIVVRLLVRLFARLVVKSVVVKINIYVVDDERWMDKKVSIIDILLTSVRALSVSCRVLLSSFIKL